MRFRKVAYLVLAGLLGVANGTIFSIEAISEWVDHSAVLAAVYTASWLILFPTVLMLMGDPSVPLLSVPRLTVIALNGLLYAGVFTLVRWVAQRPAR